MFVPLPSPFTRVLRHVLTSRVSRFSLTSCALALLSACGIEQNFEDLGDDLFVPDVGYIQVPGKLISAGNYRQHSVRAPNFEERYVAAFEDKDSFVLIRFQEEGEKCVVGKAKVFGNTFPGLEEGGEKSEREPLIPYLVNRDSAGRGELRFTNFACETLELTVPDVPLPRVTLEHEKGANFIVRDGSGVLLALDPWNGKSKTLATAARSFDVRAGALWSEEEGQVVLRDSSLRVLGRTGTAVSESAINAAGTFGAYVDGGTLFVVEAQSVDKPKEVAEDVCNVRHEGGSQERLLSFFSPCAERRLVLYNGVSEARTEYADNVITNSVVWSSSAGLDLNYWRGEAGAESGELWIALAGKEPTLVASNAIVDPGRLFKKFAATIADWDGNTGTYIQWSGGVTQEIANDVAEINGLGILANYKDRTGDLLRLLDSGKTQKIASKVPLDATHGGAFIANSDGNKGDLFIFEEGQSEPEKIASGVTPHAFLFSIQVETLLIFLSDLDEEKNTATLEVRLLDTGDQFKVSSGVNEILEVGFPSAGILYNVAAGKREGLWFATAQ